jgi:hypothetical protein
MQQVAASSTCGRDSINGRFVTVETNRQQRVQELFVFALLVAIGVAGRWGQPTWCFTPLGAAAVFAGFYFSRAAVALLVPLAILGVSDLLLPAYDNVPVMLMTYAVSILPVCYGRVLARGQGMPSMAGVLAICGVLPATLFYLVTNFGVWAFQSDYEKSLAGLIRCYGAAMPFFRWMLAGDLFYLAVIFGCWLLAGVGETPAMQQALERVRK